MSEKPRTSLAAVMVFIALAEGSPDPVKGKPAATSATPTIDDL
jgi:hypothetical protein